MIFDEFFDFFEDADATTDQIAESQVNIEGVGTPPEFCNEVDEYLNDENDVQVFFALDRMTHEVDGVDPEAVENYISSKKFDEGQFQGLMNNWKGVYGEVEVLEHLNENAEDGIEYKIPRYINNPGVDIYGMDESGNVVEKYQVKMSLDKSYLNETLASMPEDVKLICPSEVAGDFDPEKVVDTGISLASVQEELDTICDVVEQREPWEKELDPGFFDWLSSADIT